MAIAEDILRNIDITDSPFLALAMALSCSIWSNDGHFQRQDKVVVYTTKDLAIKISFFLSFFRPISNFEI